MENHASSLPEFRIEDSQDARSSGVGSGHCARFDKNK